MARLQITIGVWDSGGSAVKSIQGESNSRILEITFLDKSGQPIDLTGATPRMYVNDQFVDGTILDATGGKAEFPVTSGMLSKPGNWPIEFLLSGPDYPPLKANGLMLKVDASHVENAVESDDKYSSLVIALNRADAAADKAEQAKTDSETAVANANTAIGNISTKNQEITAAESARVTSENGRVAAESARVSQENARKTAETTRQSQEGTRQSQESTRQTNETARGAAETTRSQNEDTRNGNEAARKTAEQDRAAAEADRQTHEADRRNVEDARVGAEQNRATAETARAAAETTRQQQETTRQTQETGRVNAESARVTAENKRQTDTQTAISGANTARDSANTAADRANTAAQNAEDAISGKLDPAIDARISAQKNQANGIAGLDGSGKVAAAQLPAMDYIPTSQRGAANGVAALDGSKKVPASQLPSMDYVPNSQKGTAGGVATLGDDGKVPAEQLSIPAPNYAGTLVVHVTSSDGGSVAGTRVRIRNEQLGSNYVQPLDALGNTTFSLLDNHTYYVVLLDYPSSYYGAAATVTITGGETQELDLVLKTEPDIVGWDLDQTSGSLTYTDGAADHIPMSITDGELDTGSWANSWLTKMRPCLLKDGVVQYYLKKTGDFLYDYSKQANGLNADITSGDDGDVMIEFPLVYYKFYTSTDVNGHNHVGCKYSQTAQDDTWCCNAWLDRNGVPQEVMYMAAYDGIIYNNALRSLSGQTPTASQTIGTFRTAANANGSGYEQQEWTKRAFVQSLLPMLFKSLDSQAAVGKGNTATSAAINTGTMDSKPLFWGDQTGTAGAKFCGIENFWGNISKFCDGLENVSGACKYKIYGPYNDTASGYTDAGTIGGTNGQYTDTMQTANGYGMLPKTTVVAEADSKFHDYLYKGTSGTYICYTGGDWSSGAGAGAWDLYLRYSASNTYSYIGASLSYTPA